MRRSVAVAAWLVAVSGTLLAQSAPTITTSSLPFGSVGGSYSSQLAATGGTGSYTWSLSAGSLPPGLSLDPSKGVIGGSPTTGGTYNFTVRATDRNSQSGTKALSIGIAQISNSSPLPNATVGQLYSVSFAVTDAGGASFIFSVGSGSLPPGLSLGNSGVLTGSPTTSGTYNFFVSATTPTSAAVIYATKSFTLTVNSPAAPLAITSTSPLPSGDAGSPYKATLAAIGGAGSYRWAINSGALPPGLNLDVNAGVISGVPTAAGTSNFGILVNDSTGARALKTFALTINPALVITNPSPLPNGIVGQQYLATFVASGGSSPYSFVATQISPFDPNVLPPGLTLGANGVLSGTPTVAGAYNFNVLLTDATGSQVYVAYALTVTGPLLITTASPLPGATVNAAYSQTIAASGGVTPYTFTVANAPPGLTLSAAGVLSGTPTAAGTFPFTVTVTDSKKTAAVKTFQITITSLAPPVTVTPLALNFAAVSGGDAPPSQDLIVLSSGTSASNFHVTLNSGSAGAAIPPWLMVKPLSSPTPARLLVTVDQGSMAPGVYPGGIRITDPNGNNTDVTVTFAVTAASPTIQVLPAFLRFAARQAAPGILEQTLTVHNSGGGAAISFSTAVLGGSPWITGIIPASGVTSRNLPNFLRVQVNSQGLAVGSYRDVIRITSSAGNMDVPVSLFVAGSGAILGVNVTGVRFQSRQGGGFSNTQSVNILNLGDPASSVIWTAELVSGANWLSISPSSGSAQTLNPGLLQVTPNASATQMAPGGYYGLIKISDPQSLNSPQYVVAVLDLQASGTPPLPDLFPAGLYFTGLAGSQPPSAQVFVHTSSATAVPFQAAASTADGGTWLSVSPSSGNSSTTQGPGVLTVAVNPAGLAPGIYSGDISVSMSGVERSVNVTLIVQPGGGGNTAAREAQATTCTPSKLAITQTGLVNNFAVPAKWPAALVVQLNDDCANRVMNGSAAATFSNGDAALSLKGDGLGNYSATWQPGVVSPEMQIKIQANAGTLQPATALLVGGISPNSAPVLFTNGTVSPFNRVAGGPLASGNIVEIYGSGLASSTVPSTGAPPIPPTVNGTFVLVGGLMAPLYYLSDGQLDAQIPSELPNPQQYPILVSANGALTLPDQIDAVPLQPSVAHFDNGNIIAQHAADYSVVLPNLPAKPGEVLVLYLLGLGPTNPSVPSGAAAPSVEPLARVLTNPTVTVDGQNATIYFAGLSPGFAGLYQINIQVPPTAKSGNLNVLVTQNGIVANTTVLPVSQ